MMRKILISFLLLNPLFVLANLTPGGSGGGGNLPPGAMAALLGGRSSGQNLSGGTNPGENLDFQSTADVDKGVIAAEDGSYFVLSSDSAFVNSGGPSYEGAQLQVVNQDGSFPMTITSLGGPGAAGNASLALSGGRGTFASPGYLQDGEHSGAISFNGSDNTDYDSYSLGSIEVTAALNQSLTNNGSNMNFFVGKSNDVGTSYLLQLNGSNRQAISDFAWIMHGPNDPGGVAAHDIALFPVDASVSGVATLGIKTAQVVGNAPGAADKSLKVNINGAEYLLHLTAN